jgi:ornithine cyclodeaminase/alanine dehydrogenase
MTLLLSRQDVQAVLTMQDAIEAVEGAFRQQALGNLIMPLRTAIRIPEHNGLHLGMPAYIGGESDALGLKVVTVYPDNPAEHGLPTTIGTLLLNDPRTGAPLAIMDAGFLTAMRTGAVSGVATKCLARQEASVVGVFGAGVQARTQLMAVCAVRSVARALVLDVSEEAQCAYCDEMSAKLGIEVVAEGDARQLVQAADILVAASSAHEPLFDGAWLRPGTHINGIGSHSPGARELDTTTILRAKVVVDLTEAALAEAGDLMIPIEEGAITADHIHATLGEVVAGQRPGRESDEEITVFKSVGLALQDVSTAIRVYHLALEKGVGQEVSL